MNGFLFLAVFVVFLIVLLVGGYKICVSVVSWRDKNDPRTGYFVTHSYPADILRRRILFFEEELARLGDRIIEEELDPSTDIVLVEEKNMGGSAPFFYYFDKSSKKKKVTAPSTNSPARERWRPMETSLWNATTLKEARWLKRKVESEEKKALQERQRQKIKQEKERRKALHEKWRSMKRRAT